MKYPLLAANWKMNMTRDQARTFCRDLTAKLDPASLSHVLIAPPYTAIETVASCLSGSVRIAAQNCHFAPNGAFTGEISTGMLIDLGVNAVIIGHSERRHVFHESQDLVTHRLRGVVESGLHAIYCVGETLEERESGRTFDVLEAQLEPLPNLGSALDKVTLAYEPVWAIGTGKVASVEQIAEVHGRLKERFSSLAVLYGGSVKSDNIRSIASLSSVDGALIGGASLKVDEFLAIIRETLIVKGV
ncbi:MAG TPA: triose-phosphate isomerase [Thermoanaerobaculia bacterium]|nr:triose-phosphate isomerase [Thermoanaerobaculia bacterium]HUM28612.1 triose-phosphate isomerase [Thermoanaerobaculia bacterium]HXK66780.1 triose-phosphate isomerase [Thermoanaerobaculia bacterium]